MTATEVGRLIHRSGRTVVRTAERYGLSVAHKVSGPNGARLYRREDAMAFAARFLADNAGRQRAKGRSAA